MLRGWGLGARRSQQLPCEGSRAWRAPPEFARSGASVWSLTAPPRVPKAHAVSENQDREDMKEAIAHADVEAVVTGLGSINEQDPPNMPDGTGSDRRDDPSCQHCRICPDSGFPRSGHGARTAARAPGAAYAGNKRTIDRIWRCGHHVSMQGRFLPVRGGGGGQALSPSTIQRRVSAGSITSSISNSEAVLIALPCSYMPATRSS